MSSEPQLKIYKDATEVTQAAAQAVVRAAERACREKQRFVCCLSGGSTPRALYELLASDAFAKAIEWPRVELYFGDERCVAPDDPASNYRMVAQALLRHVPIAPQQVHRIEAELEPSVAAGRYETALQQRFGVSEHGEPLSRFDLVLLGLGTDAHTASLFPGSSDEPERWVSARIATQPPSRITLTPLVLNAAESALFLVCGGDKAQALAQVFHGPQEPQRLPAQRIKPLGELSWFVDQAAAAALTPAAS